MVSAYELSHRRIQDREWNRLAGQLLKNTNVPVRRSMSEAETVITSTDRPGASAPSHPSLPRQLAGKQGFTLPLTIGRSIPSQELRLLQNPVAVTQYLRVATDALQKSGGPSQPAKPETLSELRHEENSDELRRAVAKMTDLRIVEHDEFDVYFAPFERLGPVMEQIAIAREKTFRAVGEGTGLSQDSDEFDPHYRHLFLWDKTECRIAGAYRVGLVDEIVAAYGVEGLYSRSLYKYDELYPTTGLRD